MKPKKATSASSFQRKRCVGCGKLLPLTWHVNYVRVDTPTGFRTDLIREKPSGHSAYGEGDALFHSLRCATGFAVAAFKAGYRVTAVEQPSGRSA